MAQHKWTLYRVLSTIDAFQEMDDEATDETVGAALGASAFAAHACEEEARQEEQERIGGAAEQPT